ncbi:MAG: nucleoside-diphosphate kinase [Candidatus Woesearchaeota archaeon]
MKMIERTLVLIKPDGIERGLIGKIIERFENVGLKIVAAKMVKIDQEFARKHYWEHVEKPFYQFIEKYITSGPVLALVLEGLHAVEVVRKLVGPTEPRKAQPGTIRGDFSHVSYAYADNKKMAVKNLIHASDSLENAKYEISLWFKPEEIIEYESVHEKHIF